MASDKLQAMRIFRRVAELGSFTAAADDLNMVPASVSKHIAFLEDQMGTRLIHRTTRRMHLSDAGLHYLNSVRRILDDLDESENRVRGIDASPVGKIRLNAPMSFGLMHLPPIIDSFLARYPDIEIDLQLSDRIVDLVEQGVDLALRIRRHLPDSSLTARRICATQRVVCASPEYLARHGTPTIPKELTNHRCLTYTLSDSPDRWQLGDQDVEVRGNLRVDSSLAIKQSLLNHQGISLIPTFLVYEELRSGALKTLLADFPPSGHFLYAVFPPGQQKPDRIRILLEHLIESFGTPPYWDRKA